MFTWPQITLDCMVGIGKGGFVVLALRETTPVLVISFVQDPLLAYTQAEKLSVWDK